MSPTKSRLDTLLAERGLFESRSRAAASVLAGDVLIGRERRRAEKPGQMVAADIEIDVAQKPRYVSRGGIKLANALEASGVDPAGRRCMDVGASTGGFTDCLLQHGAAHVIAVDVAYGELDWRIRNDARVSVFERLNARHLDRAALPYAAELIVLDLSFISLRTVLPAVLGTAAAGFEALAMVKPQFEVGRERVGKGGVVRDAGVRRDALVAVGAVINELGHAVRFHSSGLAGPKGNQETFAHIVAGAQSTPLEQLAREVEP